MNVDDAALVLAWIAIVLVALAVSGVVRQIRVLTAGDRGVGRIAGPRAGSILKVQGLGGLVPEDQPLVVIFMRKGCSSCQVIAPTLSAAADQYREKYELVVAYEGARGHEYLSANGRRLAVLEHQDDLFNAANVFAAPYAVAVDSTGRVMASGPVGSPERVTEFMESIEGSVRSGHEY